MARLLQARILLLAACVVFAFVAPLHLRHCAHAWWDVNWASRVRVHMDNSNSAGPLTDFPLLVFLNDSYVDFAKILVCPAVYVVAYHLTAARGSAYSQADGADVRLIDGDDATTLSYEIEKWDNAAQEGYVWTKV